MNIRGHPQCRDSKAGFLGGARRMTRHASLLPLCLNAEGSDQVMTR